MLGFALPRHEGKRWTVPESWVDAKPVQRPRRPVLLGAWSATGTRLEDVAATLRMPGEGGYPDAFVDLMYVASGVNAQLDWAQRLLAASSE